MNNLMTTFTEIKHGYKGSQNSAITMLWNFRNKKY